MHPSSPFIGKFIIFLCKIDKKWQTHPAFSEEPQLAPLVFKVSWSGLALIPPKYCYPFCLMLREPNRMLAVCLPLEIVLNIKWKYPCKLMWYKALFCILISKLSLCLHRSNCWELKAAINVMYLKNVLTYKANLLDENHLSPYCRSIDGIQLSWNLLFKLKKTISKYIFMSSLKSQKKVVLRSRYKYCYLESRTGKSQSALDRFCFRYQCTKPEMLT